MEVRHVGSHATADDVVEGRAQLPQVLGNNMADTLARMSADSLECDEAQVLLNTHLEQLATAIRKRDIWLTWPHTRWSQRSAPLENVQPSRGRRLDRNASGCSRRQRIRSPGLTTIVTASPVMPQSHLTGSTLGYRRARVQRPFPVSVGRGSLHESHTLTFLEDRRTWLCTACGHVSRLRALKLAQPCPRVLSKVGRRNMIAIQNGRKLD